MGFLDELKKLTKPYADEFFHYFSYIFQSTNTS